MYSDKQLEFIKSGYYTIEQSDLDHCVWLTKIEDYYEIAGFFKLPFYEDYEDASKKAAIDEYESNPLVFDSKKTIFFIIINFIYRF